MEKNFFCPRCKGYLNVDKFIVLSAKTAKSETGIIFFSPEIGNYTLKTNSNFKILQGEKYDFSCPMCKKKLASDLHDNLSRIIMKEEDGKEYEILFSQIAGEKSTYKILGESIDTYGDDKSNYINFINLSSNK